MRTSPLKFRISLFRLPNGNQCDFLSVFRVILRYVKQTANRFKQGVLNAKRSFTGIN